MQPIYASVAVTCMSCGNDLQVDSGFERERSYLQVKPCAWCLKLTSTTAVTAWCRAQAHANKE